MDYGDTLADPIRRVAPRAGFEEQTMFGGIGFLLGDHICVGIWKDSLIGKKWESGGNGC